MVSLDASMADPDSEQPHGPHVKSAKTYGKRRQDAPANLESSGAGSTNCSLGSPALGPSTEHGNLDPGPSSEINYHWKGMLNRIDEGKEDDKLEFGMSLDVLSSPKPAIAASEDMTEKTFATNEPLTFEEPSSTVHTQESALLDFSGPNHDSETPAIALELSHAFSDDGHSSEDSEAETSVRLRGKANFKNSVSSCLEYPLVRIVLSTSHSASRRRRGWQWRKKQLELKLVHQNQSTQNKISLI